MKNSNSKLIIGLNEYYGSDFQKELMTLLDRYCIENESDTPDFILSQYMRECLNSYNVATLARDRWYNFDTTINGGIQ